jgi:hypothetical protein
MKRWNDKKLSLLAVAAVMITGVSVLILWTLIPNRGTRQTTDSTSVASPSMALSTAAFAQPKAYPCPIAGDFKSVDIPVGLLCDYYEHGIEHAPPRDPSGVMQKRERFYAAPHDPFELLEFVAGSGALDRELRVELTALRSDWWSGRAPSENDVKSLERLALQSSLRSDVLIESGRAIDWLVDDELAAALFTSGAQKARAEYTSVRAGDVVALPVLRAMDQTKALWRLKKWATLEVRFRMAQALYIPLSVEQRRAHYLVADMLYSEGRYDSAAAEIAQVSAEHEREHDLGLLDRSDVPEMQWTQGLFLMADERLGEATAFLDRCATHEGVHQLDSRRLAALAAIRSDHLDEAIRRVRQLPLPAPRDALTQTIRIELAARLKKRMESRS